MIWYYISLIGCITFSLGVVILLLSFLKDLLPKQGLLAKIGLGLIIASFSLATVGIVWDIRDSSYRRTCRYEFTSFDEQPYCRYYKISQLE